MGLDYRQTEARAQHNRDQTSWQDLKRESAKDPPREERKKDYRGGLPPSRFERQREVPHYACAHPQCIQQGRSNPANTLTIAGHRYRIHISDTLA
jgi:hypothetical protein